MAEGTQQYSLFIGHFVTIAFKSRLPLPLPLALPFPFSIYRCSLLVSPFCRIVFRVAFDFQFALWHFLCVYGIDR